MVATHSSKDSDNLIRLLNTERLIIEPDTLKGITMTTAKLLFEIIYVYIKIIQFFDIQSRQNYCIYWDETDQSKWKRP